MPKKEKKKETSNVLTLSTLFGHLSIYAGLRQFSGGEEEKKKKKRKRGKRKRRRKIVFSFLKKRDWFTTEVKRNTTAHRRLRNTRARVFPREGRGNH